MATNIPPHNLSEISRRSIKLLDNPDLTTLQLCRWVKGPDFPTGGHILNSPDELKEIYKTGSGSIRLRSTWEAGPSSRSGKKLYITSIPYAVNKAQLVEQIGDVVLSRKMPHLVDVKDVSTDDVRIELELKARRRRQPGDGVPVQEHLAADDVCREHDVPGADGERRGRPPRAARPQADALALPPLPPGGRDQPSRARARAAQEAHPHPRGLREGLRRARRDHQDHPQVGRQGRFGREDHEAVLARRRADRRDPRAQAVSPGSSRNPRHPEGARREAQALAPDCRRCSRTRKAAGSWCARSSKRSRASTATPRSIRAARASRRPKKSNTPPNPSSSKKTTSSLSRAMDG